VSQNPTVLVAAQMFDGIAGACFGIMVPLIVSDVAGRSGHFNLSLGAVGFGVGIGATLSTPAAGWIADHVGTKLAFFALLAIGLLAVLMAFIMPETRPSRDAGDDADRAGAGADPPKRDERDPVTGTPAPAVDDAPQSGPLPPDENAKPKPPARRRA
jgi:MFS family permease